MKRVFSRILRVLGIVLAAAVVVIGVWHLLGPVIYPDFYKNMEKVQTIPDLAEGFVPQGVTRIGDDGPLLICGYMSGKSASRVYVCGQDGIIRKILLTYADGKTYTGHAGGLTAAGDYVYISNASKLFVLDTKALLAAPDGSSLAFLGSFEVPCRSSFCSSDGENIYVGEYHAPGYDTRESHRVKTADGESYQAIVFAYPFNASE